MPTARPTATRYTQSGEAGRERPGPGVKPPETDLRCFAVRRLNPFEGVLQVVESDTARAYSQDGRIWQIQVLAQRPDHTWRSFSHAPPIEQFFNFGLWDEQGGVQRIPANPIMDIGSMSATAGTLAGSMAGLLDQLPFKLTDHYEYWSIDLHGEPVALLASTEDPERMRDMRPGRWQAARLADHSFVSASLLAGGMPTTGELGPRQHIEKLERLVRRLGPHKTWFHRRKDGTGEPIGPTGEPTGDRVRRMPPLGIRTDWENPADQALVDDYLAWRSPQLLTLQDIDETLRCRLETLACRRAVELAAVFRLIPRILDQDSIEAARVEATLRRAAN